jgi:hypothetical protein
MKTVGYRTPMRSSSLCNAFVGKAVTEAKFLAILHPGKSPLVEKMATSNHYS